MPLTARDYLLTKDFYLTLSLRASSPGRSGGGAGKEGELACTLCTSLESEYLHRKSRCEILIGGDDISNEDIALGTDSSPVVSKLSLLIMRDDWGRVRPLARVFQSFIIFALVSASG